jgi:hypothetical protein
MKRIENEIGCQFNLYSFQGDNEKQRIPKSSSEREMWMKANAKWPFGSFRSSGSDVSIRYKECQ